MRIQKSGLTSALTPVSPITKTPISDEGAFMSRQNTTAVVPSSSDAQNLKELKLQDSDLDQFADGIATEGNGSKELY